MNENPRLKYCFLEFYYCNILRLTVYCLEKHFRRNALLVSFAYIKHYYVL